MPAIVSYVQTIQTQFRCKVTGLDNRGSRQLMSRMRQTTPLSRPQSRLDQSLSLLFPRAAALPILASFLALPFSAPPPSSQVSWPTLHIHSIDRPYPGSDKPLVPQITLPSRQRGTGRANVPVSTPARSSPIAAGISSPAQDSVQPLPGIPPHLIRHPPKYVKHSRPVFEPSTGASPSIENA